MKRTKLGFSFAWLFMSLQVVAQSGYQIKGTVKDANGVNLSGAHVFLANTTYGAVTDRDGKYQLGVSKMGNYQLVVSFAGYKNFTLNLNLVGNSKVDVVLEPLIRDLGGFTITARKDRKWRERLMQFKQVFLGTSENAQRSKIINELDIDFYYNEDENILEAFSENPIIIKNKALDYEIEFYLEEFRIYYSQAYSVIFGFPLFKEIYPNRVSGSRDKNRLNAYNGSIEHFFKTISENKLLEEGYLLRKGYENDLGQLVITNDTIESVFRSDSTQGDVLQWGFNDYWVIDYKEKEDVNYENYKYGINLLDTVSNSLDVPFQRSWIKLKDLEVPVQFERSGYVLNPLSFAQYGYWGFEKIADRVPLNYQPKQKNVP